MTTLLCQQETDFDEFKGRVKTQGLKDFTAIKQEVQVGSKSNTLRLNN